MKQAKQPNMVLGKRMNCPNFVQCPLCYGCRNYSTADEQCKKCAVDKKNNVCNVELHKAELIAKLVRRDKITIDNKTIEFKK